MLQIQLLRGRYRWHHDILLRAGSGASSLGVPNSERSEEHTSELQSHLNLVCRLLLEKKKHNLHTPLTSIRGFAEPITDVAIEDTTHGDEVIICDSRRLKRLVSDATYVLKRQALGLSS